MAILVIHAYMEHIFNYIYIMSYTICTQTIIPILSLCSIQLVVSTANVWFTHLKCVNAASVVKTYPSIDPVVATRY